MYRVENEEQKQLEMIENQQERVRNHEEFHNEIVDGAAEHNSKVIEIIEEKLKVEDGSRGTIKYNIEEVVKSRVLGVDRETRIHINGELENKPSGRRSSKTPAGSKTPAKTGA